MDVKQCEYDVYGRGRCGKNIAPERTHCAVHRKEKCTECGKQADYDCSRYIRTWVCGSSVCNRCREKHNEKQHTEKVGY